MSAMSNHLNLESLTIEEEEEEEEEEVTEQVVEDLVISDKEETE